MLVHLEKMQELIRQLIREVDSWVDTHAATPLSTTARQRWQFLRYQLRELYRRHEELLDQVPDSALETAQQQPVFWRGVEQELVVLLRRDSQLDGITLTLDKLGREQAKRPQRGQIRHCIPLEDLLP